MKLLDADADAEANEIAPSIAVLTPCSISNSNLESNAYVLIVRLYYVKLICVPLSFERITKVNSINWF